MRGQICGVSKTKKVKKRCLCVIAYCEESEFCYRIDNSPHYVMPACHQQPSCEEDQTHCAIHDICYSTSEYLASCVETATEAPGPSCEEQGKPKWLCGLLAMIAQINN